MKTPKRFLPKAGVRIFRTFPFCVWAAKQVTDECIEWPYSLTPNGYTRTVYNGVRTSAHRVTLELAGGPPPTPEHFAAHAPLICHNPKCVNPRHLRWATPKENVHDKAIDGTRGGVTGIKGVSPLRSKFRAYVYRHVNGSKKQIHLGTFGTKEEAAIAVSEAEKSHAA